MLDDKVPKSAKTLCSLGRKPILFHLRFYFHEIYIIYYIFSESIFFFLLKLIRKKWRPSSKIAAIITASLRIIYFYPKYPSNSALVYIYLHVKYTVIYV